MNNPHHSAALLLKVKTLSSMGNYNEAL